MDASRLGARTAPTRPDSNPPNRAEARRVAFPLCSFAAAIAVVLPALAQGPPSPVLVDRVEMRDIPATIRLVGTVLPQRSATVAAEVSGVIAEWVADEGAFLRVGDAICRLDPQLATLALDEARGRLASLQAYVQELENGTRVEVIEQLRAQMDEAQAMLEKWEMERRRVDDLYGRNQASLKEKNDTDQEYLAGQRRFTQSQAAWKEAVNGPRHEEIARARADALAQQAVVARLERDLKKTEVRAPFDGFVVAKRSEVGEWIAAGGAVCDMVSTETVKIRADVPEHAAAFARSGAPATVRIDALNRVIEGAIARVIPRVAESARTFPVEIDVSNASHDILPGMFAWAHVPAGADGPRLVASKDAVVVRGGVPQVFVVQTTPDGAHIAMPMPVTLGLEWETRVEVRADGLTEGALLVVRGNERLFGPSPVLPQPIGGASPSSAPASAPAAASAGEVSGR